MTRVLLVSLAALLTAWTVVAVVLFAAWLRFRYQWRQERPKAQGRTVDRQAFMADEFEASVLRDMRRL